MFLGESLEIARGMWMCEQTIRRWRSLHLSQSVKHHWKKEGREVEREDRKDVKKTRNYNCIVPVHHLHLDIE